MKAMRPLTVLAILALFPSSAGRAQNPTGTLIGSMRDAEGGVLPGVTVTATSPNLQGSRVSTSDGNGNYKLAFLPAGIYTVSYELDGFTTAVRQVKLSAAQDAISDITMQLAGVSEEIVVTSNVETISETNTVASTTTQEELESLPVDRTPLEAVNLSPGVADTGPSTEPSIHGAMSFENLYMINGVVVNENVRGQFLPLFIEDAIQETTTTTAGVSAEFGRFTGGVVNVVTKSGGNEFSGSLRVNLVNEDWVSADNRFALNPDASPNVDDLGQIYEATLGGPLWKDRLWFFTSARDREETGSDSTTLTNIQYPTSDSEERLEGKLTMSLAQGHTVIGSYLEIDRTRSGSTFGSVMDLRSINNRTDPQEISSANYSGILTSNFFVEAQYSERDYEIATGFGGPQDLIDGTMVRHRPTDRRFWSSTFCGSCEPELRNNENQLAKASYFLTTENLGTHDIAFGYDTFSDIRFAVNHQTGSDFQVWAEDIHIDSSNNIYPIFRGSTTWVVWWPPVGLDIAQPTDFATNSFYVNDSWQFNDRWSFNIGVRYDENDGVDSSGNLVADDSKFSPRLGFSWDVEGDGDLIVNGSYGTYVAQVASGPANSTSTGGALAGFFSFYGGPVVNGNCPPDCVTTDVALQTLFDWYLGGGGTTDVDQALANLDSLHNVGLFYSSVPGPSLVIRQGLKSQSSDEITVGVTKRLGTKGMLRADAVYRDWEDFYAGRTNLGETYDVDGDGTPDGDVIEVGNFANDLRVREYTGFEVQGRYRFTDRFTLAGNYTWSETEGNFDGETAGSGPVISDINAYPEFVIMKTEYPIGKLAIDQTHKLRVWGVYDIIETSRHSLNVSLLQSFSSGTPYGAQGNIPTDAESLTGAAVRSMFPAVSSYAAPPESRVYYYTARDAFRTDDVTRTDLALNYAFNFNISGQDIEIFLQPEIVNLFDENAVVDPVTSIIDPNNNPFLADFNAFTDTPVEGVNWVRHPDFGEADHEDDFQQPRTFRLSVGLRF